MKYMKCAENFITHKERHPDGTQSLIYRVIDLGQIALDKEDQQPRSKIKINKAKIRNLTGHRTLFIGINRKSIEIGDQLVYLVSVVSVDRDTELDVARGLNSTRFAFTVLPKMKLKSDS